MFALPEKGGDGPSTAKLNSLEFNIFVCLLSRCLLVSQPLSFSGALALSAQEQLSLGSEGS